MSDNSNEEKITYVDPLVPVTDDTHYTTYVGAGRGAKTRYGIAFPVPSNDDDAKERYNCTLNDLVRMGVQKIATAPNFGSVMFDDLGDLMPNGHTKGQELADSYKVGQRRAGGGLTAAMAKKKASAAEAVAINLAAEAGMSPEEVKAMIDAVMNGD